MKIKTFLIIALIMSIVLLAGCTEQSSSPAPSGPVGGGCGFAAPAENANDDVCSLTTSAGNIKTNKDSL